MVKKLFAYGFVRHSLALISPDILQIILKALTALVTAKILGPENLGFIAMLGLIVSYGALFQAGITDGIGLKVPLLIGQKKYQEAEIYVNKGFGGVMTIVSSMAFIFLVAAFLVIDDDLVLFGIVANSICLLIFQVHQYYEAKARLFYNFREVFYSQNILAISQFIFTVTATYYLGIIGVFISILFIYIPSIIYLKFKNKEIVHFKWDFETNIELIKLGFPILILGLIVTLFTTVDKWFILTSYGVEKLGYYSVIIGLAAMVSMVPNKFGSLLKQYLIEAAGTKCSAKRMWEFASSLLLIVLLLLIPLVAAASHFTHFLISAYLTQFALSLPLIDILLLSVYVSTIFSFCAAFLIALGQRVLILKVQFLGLVMAVLFNAVAVYLDSGLFGIAVATLGANLFLNIFILFCVYSAGVDIKNMRLVSILVINILGFAMILLGEKSDSVGEFPIIEYFILFFQRVGWDLLFTIFVVSFIYFSKIYRPLEGFLNRDFSD
jgi:O-antigen/teichoic acid export membrane protein